MGLGTGLRIQHMTKNKPKNINHHQSSSIIIIIIIIIRSYMRDFDRA